MIALCRQGILWLLYQLFAVNLASFLVRFFVFLVLYCSVVLLLYTCAFHTGSFSSIHDQFPYVSISVSDPSHVGTDPNPQIRNS
jgi:hypothetical protein